MTLEQAPVTSDPAPSPVQAPAPDDSPPVTEQAPQESAPQPASKRPPANTQALQAGLTRTTQENAALKKALGLNGRATTEQTLEAITQLRNPAPEGEYDAEYEAREQGLREREYTLATRAHDEEVVGIVRQIEELSIAGASPLDLTDAVVELATKLASQMTADGQAAPPPDQATGQAPGKAPQAPDGAGIDMEGESPVGWYVKPDEDELGSGDTEGAAKRLLSKIPRRR